MNTTKIKLWFVNETEKARCYNRTPPDRGHNPIWIPISIIEGTTKYPVKNKECPVHIVTLPNWFVDRNNL